eukprot:TRINITY_DN31105_c0_g1_i1.p1 TRINITY_DN31105_c0_g1~~TRINITY_DN31105_c0_g1_i1.p1  ORF type:complete len:173 (+),score=19.22 TRINITY_DN31105_c0_g1_i1:78-521(+)
MAYVEPQVLINLEPVSSNGGSYIEPRLVLRVEECVDPVEFLEFTALQPGAEGLAQGIRNGLNRNVKTSDAGSSPPSNETSPRVHAPCVCTPPHAGSEDVAQAASTCEATISSPTETVGSPSRRVRHHSFPFSPVARVTEQAPGSPIA